MIDPDDFGLTEHEVRVIRIRIQSSSDRDAARRLGVAYPTIKNELLRIRKKLGAESTFEAAMIFLGIRTPGSADRPIDGASRSE